MASAQYAAALEDCLDSLHRGCRFGHYLRVMAGINTYFSLRQNFQLTQEEEEYVLYRLHLASLEASMRGHVYCVIAFHVRNMPIHDLCPIIAAQARRWHVVEFCMRMGFPNSERALQEYNVANVGVNIGRFEELTDMMADAESWLRVYIAEAQFAQEEMAMT